MTKIPQRVNDTGIPPLERISQGKVRDTYALKNPTSKTGRRVQKELLLQIATDRVSIFDFVLPGTVPQKGEVLTAMNVFWKQKLSQKIRQDFIATGKAIDRYLPPELQGNPTFQKYGTVVEKLTMVPVEAVVRGYLTGSGWSAYAKTSPKHIVCGHRLLSGLKDGDILPEPIFTPTTKAAEGHDEPIDFEIARKRFGYWVEINALHLFKFVSKIARERGIIIADTKLEFGKNSSNEITLGDERFTPDSSRFWLLKDWEESRTKGTSPISFDKQFVREWGKTVGIDKLDPMNPKDIEYVHSLIVPTSVLLATRQIYRYIFYLLTGMRLETFQRKQMGIQIPESPVEIILGSESDIPQAANGMEWLYKKGIPFRHHIISCHRNPEVLRKYAESAFTCNRPIIAAAGKAAALPGMLQSWLRYYGKGHLPVLGVALNGNNFNANVAASLSIEELPGRPVILKEDGTAYFGARGFTEACRDAATKEFFTPPLLGKEARLNIPYPGVSAKI